MPYKNIVWIKLYLDLFDNDDRFLYQLNESQQLLYLKLLYLAGRTYNKIPKNARFICHKINYSHEESCFQADIERIKAVFPKFKEDTAFFFFENFDELHNWVKEGKELQRNSKGTPKEVRRELQDKDKDKEKIKIKKNKHLDFVYLTKEEHQKLIDRYGSKPVQERIDRLNNYIGSTGKQYKSHYHTILSWISKDNDKPEAGTAIEYKGKPPIIMGRSPKGLPEGIREILSGKGVARASGIA